eukprot:jgi/Astpho2/7447/fgenesh1_pm.00114_%23_28_t
MFYGADIPLPEAHQQMSTALDAGCNFLDTAEMYPIPQAAEHAGRSEAVVGSWLKQHRREDVLIATKVAGPSGQMQWIRGGPRCLDAQNITEAIDGSLHRLQTDYIDLIQLHWPDRYVPMFGETDYDPARAYSAVPLEEQLTALTAAVQAGKVRHVGVSNETAWGLTTLCSLRRHMPELAPIVSLQNAYSLLCRTFDAALAECCHAEGVGMLAYSPLAMGLLTGKYMAGGGLPTARLNRYKGRYAEGEGRYGPTPARNRAVLGYVKAARQHGIEPLELALRFVLGHPLITSAVIGASSLDQLQELLDASQKGPLSEQGLSDIDAVHQDWPSPCP